MQELILVVHVLLAVIIVALVLVQHGLGADAGASFGAGASNSMFGSQGSMSFLFKLTMGLALLFVVTSLYLTYASNRKQSVANVLTVSKNAAANASNAQPAATTLTVKKKQHA